MTNGDFEQAARQLLQRLAIDPGSGPLRTPADLAAVCDRHGCDMQEVEVLKGRLADTNGIKGGILLGAGRPAISFMLGDKGDIRPEQASVKFHADDYDRAWVIRPKATDIGEVPNFIARYSRRFADLLLCALVINFFALLFPLFSSFVYDKVLGNNIVETLWAVAICLLIVMGVEFCLRIIRINAAERFAVASETDIDYGVFQRLLDTPGNKIPPIASFIEKYKQVLSYRDFLSSSYILSIVDVPFTVLFLLAIAFIGGPIVFIALICGIVMALINGFLIRPVLRYDAIAKVGSEKRFGLTTDLLLSREVIIGGAFRNDLQQRLQQVSVEAAVATGKSRYWRGFTQSISSSLSYFSYVAVIVAGVYMVEARQMTAGGLLAVSMLTSRAMSSMSSVSNLILRYREFKIALKELSIILPEPARRSASPRGRLKGSVRFDNVSITLKAGHKPVLENFTFGIGSGEIVGIAGAPGSGKTTLLRLIAGTLTPDYGTVLIDNIPVGLISPDDLTGTLGYKPQEVSLLEGSIEDNVRAGRSALTPEDRQRILQSSGLGIAFRDSKLDWETQIGPRGSYLSGGQRQLVSIARAMLYSPSLLLLDEPTNGLDAALETLLARQIEALRGTTTVLVSTHSQTILSACDRIIAIGQSRILADGPRDKILARP